MDVLRTPESRFEGLPGWPLPARRFEVPGSGGVEMAYVDAGPADAGRVFLCLHGNPSWGYLYRKMIPVWLESGGRVVVPDLVGFGRSDKPLHEADHGFDFHRESLLRFVDTLDLKGITLVVQDWGGILGLTLPLERPERYARLLVMNTAFGIGELTEGFRAWRTYSNSKPDLDVGALLARSEPTLSRAEVAAYDAPFPDARHKAALRAFPNLVPDGVDAPGAAVSRAARDWFGRAWRGQSFMAIGMKDPVLGEGAMLALRRAIPGCPEPLRIAEGGHFVQEHGERIARAALAHWGGR
jgi:pimeloyl-ACP methyl ester carboxylesterase